MELILGKKNYLVLAKLLPSPLGVCTSGRRTRGPIKMVLKDQSNHFLFFYNICSSSTARGDLCIVGGGAGCEF